MVRGRVSPTDEEIATGYEHLIGLDAEGELLWYERRSDQRTIEDWVLGEDGLLYAAAGEDGLVVLQPSLPDMLHSGPNGCCKPLGSASQQTI